MFNLINKIQHISGSLVGHFSLPHRDGWGGSLLGLFTVLTLHSCIEPPLLLPVEEVKMEMRVDVTNIELVWNMDIEWHTQWYYGWDEDDLKNWGPIAYEQPTSFEVRRYFLGDTPGSQHTTKDGFTIYTNNFRRTYEFGYYDMLIWSNVDKEELALIIDDSDINDDVHASTTFSHGMKKVVTRTETENFNVLTGGLTDNMQVTALFNQPEVFYGAYARDVYISRNKEDYDYYDEVENCWVKKLNCELVPRVYIYLVQVILKNNMSGRIKVSGENAVSNLSAGTSVNTGKTWNMPSVVYFQSRLKEGIDYKGETVDVIGGKFTTFGLCDMPGYESGSKAEYNGSRTDLPNYLFMELAFSNGKKETLQINVTDQMRRQAHGGVITIVLDAKDIPDPPVDPDVTTPSLFVPTVEDYDEIIYDIIM